MTPKRYISEALGTVDRLPSVSSISQLFHLLQTINYVSLYSPENPADADSGNFQTSALWSSFSPVVICVIYWDSLFVVVSTLEYIRI